MVGTMSRVPEDIKQTVTCEGWKIVATQEVLNGDKTYVKLTLSKPENCFVSVGKVSCFMTTCLATLPVFCCCTYLQDTARAQGTEFNPDIGSCSECDLESFSTYMCTLPSECRVEEVRFYEITDVQRAEEQTPLLNFDFFDPEVFEQNELDIIRRTRDSGH